MHIPRLSAGRIVRSLAGVFIALSLVTGAMAANADGKSASSAIPLTNIATGNLVGSNIGSFAYYTFNYPGDGSTGTLTLSITPGDPVTEGYLGINAYQAGALLANMNAVGSTPGVNSVTFSSTTAGPVLVQVWNYGPSVAASYQLQLTGVNQTVSTPAPQIVATPIPVAFGQAPTSNATSGDGSPASPFTLSGTATGMLPGNASGNFVYYTLPYSGGGAIQNVQLSFAPGGADIGSSVFVNVYQAGVTLATIPATQNAGNPPGVVPVSYSSAASGPVLIQIGNYNRDTTISYTLSH